MGVHMGVHMGSGWMGGHREGQDCSTKRKGRVNQSGSSSGGGRVLAHRGGLYLWSKSALENESVAPLRAGKELEKCARELTLQCVENRDAVSEVRTGGHHSRWK